MTLHKALIFRDDVYRFYVKIKEAERKLVSTSYIINAFLVHIISILLCLEPFQNVQSMCLLTFLSSHSNQSKYNLRNINEPVKLTISRGSKVNNINETSILRHLWIHTCYEKRNARLSHSQRYNCQILKECACGNWVQVIWIGNVLSIVQILYN